MADGDVPAGSRKAAEYLKHSATVNVDMIDSACVLRKLSSRHIDMSY